MLYVIRATSIDHACNYYFLRSILYSSSFMYSSNALWIGSVWKLESAVYQPNVGKGITGSRGTYSRAVVPFSKGKSAVVVRITSIPRRLYEYRETLGGTIQQH